MLKFLARWFPFTVVMFLAAGVTEPFAYADPVAAHHLEGTLHGYLSIRDEAGQVIAGGDLIQIVRGDRVTAHLIFHFKDGSLDDETTVFTQRGNFRLVSDRHIQKGPFFSHPMDVFIDANKGQVTVRSLDKDGGEAKVDHVKMPPDLCSNLMLITIAKNLPSSATDAKVSMLVATPKPRLVKLAFSSMGPDDFSIAGFEHKASHFQIKFEIQGIAGMIAPIIGKQPPDVELWVQGGEVPAFVKESGPLAEGSPVVSIQQTTPVGPKEPNTASTK